MCFLHFFCHNKKKKKIYPIFNKFEDDVFYNIFVIDKYSIDIELPCQCTNIDKQIEIKQNYFI